MPRLSKRDPRAVALKILIRWEKGKPLLDELLSQVLTKSVLPDERDRALVGELVNGVIRHLYYIDFVINRFSKEPLDKMDAEVRNVLRLGAYQIIYTRIPERVALAESLKILTKRKRGQWIKNLVNAVLHRIAENKTQLPEPPRVNPVIYLSVKYSFPEWLINRWLKRWSFEEVEALLKASNSRPPFVVRVNLLKVTRDNLLTYLKKEEVPEARACPYSPAGIILEGFRGKITDLKAYHFGWISIQDSASQLVGYVLNPKPGQRVLDACAGVGGKTTHIAELMENKGTIWAFDLYPWRLEKLKENFQRLGLKPPKVFQGDVVEELEKLGNPQFDKILIDAPCTGTGVIRKHPDIKWARSEEDFVKVPEKQLRLLKGLAGHLKKGGVMVYATCSLEPEENEFVISKFLEEHPEFEAENLTKFFKKVGLSHLNELVEEEKFLKTLPHHHDMDGFFVARLRKRG